MGGGGHIITGVWPGEGERVSYLTELMTGRGIKGGFVVVDSAEPMSGVRSRVGWGWGPQVMLH